MQGFFDFIFRGAGNIIYKSIVCVSSVHDRLILYRIYRQNQTDSNTYNNFQAECFFKAIDKVYTKE